MVHAAKEVVGGLTVDNVWMGANTITVSILPVNLSDHSVSNYLFTSYDCNFLLLLGYPSILILIYYLFI